MNQIIEMTQPNTYLPIAQGPSVPIPSFHPHPHPHVDSELLAAGTQHQPQHIVIPQQQVAPPPPPHPVSEQPSSEEHDTKDL